jgi:hypothetical protein
MKIISTSQFTITDTSPTPTIVLSRETIFIPVETDGSGGVYSTTNSVTASVRAGDVASSLWTISANLTGVTCTETTGPTYTITGFNSGVSIGTVRFTAVKNGVTLVKTCGVQKVFKGISGDSALSGYLTKDSATVITDYAGDGGVYTGGYLKVSMGSVNGPNGWLFSGPTEVSGILGGSIISDTGKFDLTGLDGDHGTMVLTATHIATSRSISKTFTVTKSKAAVPAGIVNVTRDDISFVSGQTGFPTEFPNSSIEVSAYIGTTKLAYATAGGNTFSLSISAVGAAVTNTGSTVSPTAITQDVAYADILTTLLNSKGALHSTITKRVLYRVNRQAKPSPPDTITAKLSDNGISVSWVNTKNVYLSAVEVWRSDTGSLTDAALIKATNGAEWVDTATFTYNKTYYYWLRSLSTFGDYSTFTSPIAILYPEPVLNITGAFTISNGQLVLTWGTVADPQIVSYDIVAATSSQTASTGTLIFSDTTRAGWCRANYDININTYYIKPKFSSGTYSRSVGKIIVASVGTPSDVSLVVIEPNIVLSWTESAGAYGYQIIVDSGIAFYFYTQSPTLTIPIPAKYTVFKIKALSSDGRYSAWASEELDVTGIYTWNEIVKLPIASFAGANYVNMTWINSNTVQRPAIFGGVIAAPYVANINDSDLWNMVDKFSVVNVDQLTCDVAWYRDKWWRTENAWFESIAYDIGAVRTGRLLFTVNKTFIDYTANIADMGTVDVGLLDWPNVDELASNSVFLTADVEISTDNVTWAPAAVGAWVTMRYCRFVVRILHASPLVDIRITSGTLILDVPDITETATTTITGGSITKVITLSKPFSEVHAVICNAMGIQAAWASSVTSTGFTLNLSANPGTVTVYWFAKGI